MTEIREDIRCYILSECLPGESASNLLDDTPLTTSGILNSMATLFLVKHIEDNAGIEVDPGEITLDNFDSIHKIVAFIERKRAAA